MLSASPHTGRIVPIYNPHCIISAADPVTNGAAKEVPVTASYPPPARAVMIFTPGATSSGLIGCPNLANPRPEKSAYACVASSYAPPRSPGWRSMGLSASCPAMPSKTCFPVQCHARWQPQIILTIPYFFWNQTDFPEPVLNVGSFWNQIQINLLRLTVWTRHPII